MITYTLFLYGGQSFLFPARSGGGGKEAVGSADEEEKHFSFLFVAVIAPVHFLVEEMTLPYPRTVISINFLIDSWLTA